MIRDWTWILFGTIFSCPRGAKQHRNIFMTSFSYDVIRDEDPVCRQVSQHHYMWRNVPGERNIFVVWKFKLLYYVIHHYVWISTRTCDCGHWVSWSTASHNIKALYFVQNIRLSSIMKFNMWYLVKSHGFYLVLLPWKVGILYTAIYLFSSQCFWL